MTPEVSPARAYWQPPRPELERRMVLQGLAGAALRVQFLGLRLLRAERLWSS